MMTALWIQLNQARKRFMTGRKRLYAGSLAYKTVLAVVPALAILMAVLAADAFTQKREQILDGFVDVIYPVEGPVGGSFLNPGEKEGIQRLNRTGKDQIHKAVRGFARHAGKVGLVGTLVFFGVLLFLVRDVEQCFNFLWGVGENRSFWAQAVRYGALVLGVPVLSVLVMSLNHWARTSYLLHPLAHLWIFSVMIPFLILWAGFALVYRWIPNAPVKPVAAFSGGLVAAFLLEAGRHGLTWYAMNAIGSSRIYGALWVFPVILLWFYLSWLIVLFGAEVAHVVQTGRLELPGREK